VAWLWHAATLLREHRGDGHTVALLAESVGETEAHVLHALSVGTPAKEFGRVWHLPAARLNAVIDGMRVRGLVGTDGWLTVAGVATKERVEALTDRLAEAPYNALSPGDLGRLVADLEPISAALMPMSERQRADCCPTPQPPAMSAAISSLPPEVRHRRVADRRPVQ
jgi:hypothetical protein